MKKVLILGAGIYQVPLIREARAMGLSPIVVSREGNYPGFKVADKVYPVDTTDIDAVLEVARREEVAGICTTGTDVAVRSIGHVCDVMHLPGISEKAAGCMTDKLAMKQMFHKGHVPTAAFCPAYSLEEAMEAAAKIGYPVMVKACDSSGSRGITKVSDPAALRDAWQLARSVTSKPYCLIEKAVEGYEIGVDAFVMGGRLKAFFPHNKINGHSNGITVPVGHSFPFNGNEKLNAMLRDAFEKIIAASGADNCAINADVMISSDQKEINILEAGARCGATGIPEIIRLYSGINYYRQILSCATGHPCDFTVTQETSAVSRLLMSPRSGAIVYIDKAALAKIAEETGAEISLDYEEGAIVSAMKNGTDRIGQILLSGKSEDEMEKIADRVLACIQIHEIENKD